LYTLRRHDSLADTMDTVIIATAITGSIVTDAMTEIGKTMGAGKTTDVATTIAARTIATAGNSALAQSVLESP